MTSRLPEGTTRRAMVTTTALLVGAVPFLARRARTVRRSGAIGPMYYYGPVARG